MKNIYVKDVIKLCEGKLLCGNDKLILDNFSKDTRSINKNDVYVGIKGEKINGNNFYKEAFDKGASCCILSSDTDVDLEKYEDKTIVLVDDTIKCLQKLAIYKRSLYDIPVIAITGSVGKTSTKDIVYEVVSRKYKTLKTEGNLNNHIGLPLTILKLKDHEALVVEMGMNHLGEISVLTNIAKPTVAIITNVGTAHIGLLGSRENILKAKLEILEGLSCDGTIIINNDNDMLHNCFENNKIKYNLITTGILNKSNIMASNIEENVFSSVFNINSNEIKVNVGGSAYIYNSLIAYAVGNLLNIDFDSIRDAIYSFKLSSHRLERFINSRGVTIIDDTYNANIDSMISAINILGKVKDMRKITLLGDMLELGQYEEELHRKLALSIVNNKIDVLVTVGPLMKKYLVSELKDKYLYDSIYSFDEYFETYDFLNELLKDNDIILLKGSNSMNIGKIVDKIK